MKSERQQVIEELEALMGHARGETDGVTVKTDAALARTLEWIRDFVQENTQEPAMEIETETCPCGCGMTMMVMKNLCWTKTNPE